VKPGVSPIKQQDVILNFPENRRASIFSLAITSARGIKSIADNNLNEVTLMREEAVKYQAEWHKKFTLSAVILLLFLIAAPLGTIIRKGGIGMPLVISVVMFIVFYAINIIGEKIGKEGIVPIWFGMWLSTFILLPIGAFITRKAGQDSATLSLERYQKFFEKLFKAESGLRLFPKRKAKKAKGA
jgi:lipopolysaccharide export system permease protein